jgi:GxxExxY protein
MDELLCKHEVYQVAGAALEVYNTLGAGFLEAVYQEAMEVELRSRGIPFESQKEFIIAYKGQYLEKTYTADLVAFGKVVVELKALDALSGKEQSQVINYLKASGIEVGLLLNFGNPQKLDWQRLVFSKRQSRPESTYSEQTY